MLNIPPHRAGQTVPKGRAAVGWRIAVHWKEDAKFYAGEVTSFDTATGRHEVLYDDGEASVCIKILLVGSVWLLKRICAATAQAGKGDCSLLNAPSIFS